MKRIIAPGDKIGGLTVIKEVDPIIYSFTKLKIRMVYCRCECGVVKYYQVPELFRKTNPTLSCGCHSTSANTYYNGPPRKHGLTSRTWSHYLYHTWSGIKRRCFNKKCSNYGYYGGRGIGMHPAWVSDAAKFAADIISLLGERPHGHTLDRIDVNGHYEPGNLRWATAKTQSLNRRGNRILTISGIALSLSQWSNITGIPDATISNRIVRGWTEEAAVTTTQKRFGNGR